MSVRLQLENITKSFHIVKALNSVTFGVEAGKITVLIGVNGAGKTTLFRTIAGLDKPDQGAIRFNGKDVADNELRQIATLVFQRSAMFSRTVYDNLAYGLKIRGEKDLEIKQKISEALLNVGLRNFERRRAKKISGGEQQRVALARAFLLKPKILLLDEPTANLDPNSALIIERAITSRKNKGTIILMATHNLSQAKRLGDEIIHMHEGKIVERADSTEFFDKPNNETTRKFINGELEF